MADFLFGGALVVGLTVILILLVFFLATKLGVFKSEK